jgi:hypothetical protein
LRIYNVYDRQNDDDDSNYDDNIYSESYDSNIINDNNNDCYETGDIDSGYDL